MKRKIHQWGPVTKSLGVGGVLLMLIAAAKLVWGQTAPGLGISLTGTNTVLLTVTNGLSSGRYQVYWTEFLSTNSNWLLLTNGSIGQTQFLAPMSDLEMAFFKATANSNFVPPSVNIIILSPTNGAILY